MIASAISDAMLEWAIIIVGVPVLIVSVVYLWYLLPEVWRELSSPELPDVHQPLHRQLAGAIRPFERAWEKTKRLLGW